MKTGVESDSWEEKSLYDGSLAAQLQIIKTLVAFANTKGGTVVLKVVKCKTTELDSAKIDDLINRRVEPNISGFVTEVGGDQSVRISVPKSPNLPHIFCSDGDYKDENGNNGSRSGWVRSMSGAVLRRSVRVAMT